jgi:hypothetical protein
MPDRVSAARAALPGRWRQVWLRGTVASALVLTVFDAGLLQRRKSFFTGGFLTDAYTTGLAGAAGFLTLSFMADAAVAGLLAAAAVWLSGRWRLSSAARQAVVFLCAAGPLLVADILTYQLLSYVGDRFDLSLMFDLSGRRVSEILAVAGQQMVRPAGFLVLAAAAAVAAVWLIHRWMPRDVGEVRLPLRGAVTVAVVCLALGSAVTLARAASDTADDGLQRKASGRALATVLELVSDVDLDGFGLGSSFSDPAPLDSSIHPFALDVPGDGVDQDGVGGDLPPGEAYTEARATPARFAHRPNVVLILLESFRADAVGRTQDGRSVTPTLDALAARGISASLAYSHNGYTAQSRFHTFTGSLANLRGGVSLVDDFKANGYEVAYFSGQDEAFGGEGYSVGFDRADVHYDARQDRARRYSTYTTAGSLAVPYQVVLERVEAFLARRDASRPLFLYINFHDTHFPYSHRGMAPLVSHDSLTQMEIVPAEAARVRDVYYNAAANVDHAIGLALTSVERSLGAPPAVVVASDHGESLFDNGFLGHGYALNEAQTRIPLVAAGLPLAVEQPFGQVELRDALAAALCAEPGTAPRLSTNPGKSIFQYLGRIDRPRQIALTTAEGRTIYDFRTERLSLPGTSAPQRPASLTGAARARFLELVQLWERMMVARAALGRAEAPAGDESQP